MPRSRLIIIGILGFVVLFFALVFLGIVPGRNQNAGGKVTLTVWGVEPQNVFSSVTTALESRYTIQYRAFDPATYESDLVNALAAGKGPDVFMFHSSWLPKHGDLLVPVSAAELSLSTFESLYPTVVEQDFAPNGAVYALPLYIDTLALLVNRDLLDSAGIALPPKTWAEFKSVATNPKLRKLDRGGKIIESSAAIGGRSNTIHHAADILSLLMLQSGVPMVSSDFTRADFSRGDAALSLYTDFANPASKNYTWNDGLGDAFDAFANGKTASVFGYASDLSTITAKNAFLKMNVVPVPQPSEAKLDVNYADYWGLAVSNHSQNSTGAWGFVLASAIDPVIANQYAVAAHRLPALRTLLQGLSGDAKWGVFANQALSARSWPQIDPNAVETAFSKMIDDVESGRATPASAVAEAESTISELMIKKNP